MLFERTNPARLSLQRQDQAWAVDMARRANYGCSFRHGIQRCNDLSWCTQELPRGGVEKEKVRRNCQNAIFFSTNSHWSKLTKSSISTASTLGPPLSISRLSCQLQLSCYTMMATEEQGGPDWDQGVPIIVLVAF